MSDENVHPLYYVCFYLYFRFNFNKYVVPQEGGEPYFI
jgi:hypothetical protein